MLTNTASDTDTNEEGTANGRTYKIQHFEISII